jgi:hypothetical protein
MHESPKTKASIRSREVAQVGALQDAEWQLRGDSKARDLQRFSGVCRAP